MDYKKVIKDFSNGTLDPKKVVLVMDNDGGYWQCIDPEIDEVNSDLVAAMLGQQYGEPQGYRDIVDVLAAAGVNCEWC